jgi:hypothetical protein
VLVSIMYCVWKVNTESGMIDRKRKSRRVKERGIGVALFRYLGECLLISWVDIYHYGKPKDSRKTAAFATTHCH